MINSPASPSDLSQRLERITRLHRRWQGWAPVERIIDVSRPSSALLNGGERSATTPVDLNGIRRRSTAGKEGDDEGDDASHHQQLPSHLARLKEIARGVAEDGSAVWSICETLTALVARYSGASTSNHHHRSAAPSPPSPHQSASVVTAALEALTLIFTPDPVLGATFRQLFELVKRAYFVDHAQFLAETNTPTSVRLFARSTTDPLSRYDRLPDAEREAELRDYVSLVTSTDWASWVTARSANMWAKAAPHVAVKTHVTDTAVALGRDAAALEAKLALHRAGKPILRRGGAAGFAHALAAGERLLGPSVDGDGSGVSDTAPGAGQQASRTSPAPSPTRGGASDDGLTMAAARDSITLQRVRMAIAFRAWRSIGNHHKALEKVTQSWVKHVGNGVLGQTFRAWRLVVVNQKCDRRGEDLRASETSFSNERLQRLDALAQLKSAERQTESLWINVQQLRSENADLVARVEHQSSDMVFDFRRPIFDAMTGAEWSEGVLRFRKNTVSDDNSNNSSPHGFVDLYFDLDYRAPPEENGQQLAGGAVAPLRPPRSHYVIRLEDAKPGNVPRPIVDPSIAALNHIVHGIARTAHRDFKRQQQQSQPSSPTSRSRSTPKLKSRQRLTEAASQSSTREPTLLEKLGIEYGTQQEKRLEHFDGCWTALCETRCIASAIRHAARLGKPLSSDEINKALRRDIIIKPASANPGVAATSSPSSPNLGDESQSNTTTAGALTITARPVANYAMTKEAVDRTIPPRRFVVDAHAFEPLPLYHISDVSALSSRPELLAAAAAALTSPACLNRVGTADFAPDGAASDSTSGDDGGLSGEDDEPSPASGASPNHSPKAAGRTNPMPSTSSVNFRNPLTSSPQRQRALRNQRLTVRALRRVGVLGRVEDAVFNSADVSISTHIRRGAMQLVCARLHAYALLKPAFEDVVSGRAPNATVNRTTTTSSALLTSDMSLGMLMSAPSMVFQIPTVASSGGLTHGMPSGLPTSTHPLLVELADQRVGPLRSDARLLTTVLEWVRTLLSHGRDNTPYASIEHALIGPAVRRSSRAANLTDPPLPPRNFGEDFGDGLSLLVATIAQLAPLPLADAHASWIATTEGVEADAAEWLCRAAADLGASVTPSVKRMLIEGSAEGRALFLVALYLAHENNNGFDVSLPAAAAPTMATALNRAPTAFGPLAVSIRVPTGASSASQSFVVPPHATLSSPVSGWPAVAAPLQMLNNSVPAKPPPALFARLSPFIAPVKKAMLSNKNADGLENVFRVVATAWVASLRAQCLRLALNDPIVLPSELHGSNANSRRPATTEWDASEDAEPFLALSYDACAQWLSPAIRSIIRAASAQPPVASSSQAAMDSAATVVPATAVDVVTAFSLPSLPPAVADIATEGAVDLQVLRSWLHSTRLTLDDARHDANHTSTSTSAGRVVAWWKAIPKEHQTTASRFATARKGPLTPITALPIAGGIELLMRAVAVLHAFFALHTPHGNQQKPPSVLVCAEALCATLRQSSKAPATRLSDTLALRSQVLMPEDAIAEMHTSREVLATLFVQHSVAEVKGWAILESRAMSRGNALKLFTRWWRECWAADAAVIAVTAAPNRATVTMGLCAALPPANAHFLIGRCFDVVFSMRSDRALRDDGQPMLPFGRAKSMKRSASTATGQQSPNPPPVRAMEATLNPDQALEALVTGKHAVPLPAARADPDSGIASRPGTVATTLAEFMSEHDCVTFSGFCEVLAGVSRLIYPLPWLRTADAIAHMTAVAMQSEMVL